LRLYNKPLKIQGVFNPEDMAEVERLLGASGMRELVRRYHDKR